MTRHSLPLSNVLLSLVLFASLAIAAQARGQKLIKFDAPGAGTVTIICGVVRIGVHQLRSRTSAEFILGEGALYGDSVSATKVTSTDVWPSLFSPR